MDPSSSNSCLNSHGALEVEGVDGVAVILMQEWMKLFTPDLVPAILYEN